MTTRETNRKKKRILLFLLPLCVLTPPLQAQERIKEQVFLKFIKPTFLVRTLMGSFLEKGEKSETKSSASLIPKGLTLLVPSDVESSLTVAGTPESISDLKTLLRLLDVQAKEVTAKVRLIRRTSESKEVLELAQFSLATTNNNPSENPLFVEGKSRSLTLTPHINGDNTISWLVEVEQEGEKRERFYHRIKQLTYYIALNDISEERNNYLKTQEGKELQGGAMLPPGDYLEITLTNAKIKTNKINAINKINN